jgi:aminobenzoyl-glutamate utilization protein B
MLLAAKAIAATALDLYTRPELLERAGRELLRRREGKPYACPIPDGINPPIPKLAS